MTISRRSGTNWVLPSNIRRRVGSSWVDVENIYRRSGSSWITVYTRYTAPTATATPSLVQGNDSGPLMTGLVVASVLTSATATGGTGNYTYLWQRVSGSTLIAPQNATNRQARFEATIPMGTTTATWRCGVSDGVTTVYTNNISVQLTYTQGGGGPGPIT